MEKMGDCVGGAEVSRRMKPCMIDGIAYASQAEAAHALGVTKQAISYRLRHGCKYRPSPMLGPSRPTGRPMGSGACSTCGEKGHNRLTCARRNGEALD